MRREYEEHEGYWYNYRIICFWSTTYLRYFDMFIPAILNLFNGYFFLIFVEEKTLPQNKNKFLYTRLEHAARRRNKNGARCSCPAVHEKWTTVRPCVHKLHFSHETRRTLINTSPPLLVHPHSTQWTLSTLHSSFFLCKYYWPFRSPMDKHVKTLRKISKLHLMTEAS